MDRPWLIVLRNVAIIGVLAFGVAVLPGGDNAANAVLATLTLIMVIAIGYSLHILYGRSELTLSTLSDGRRAAVYGGVAAIVLMFAAADEMLDTGLGALAWIAVIVASGMIIFTVWREANSY